MLMKTRTGKIILSAAALIFSILAACIGMGLLADSGLTFVMRLGAHIRGSYDRHSVQKVSIAALQTAASAERRNGNGSK